MKRYLLFYGEIYYACGGMDDFLGDYDTIEEAKKAVEEKINADKYYDTIEEMWQYKWAHIWDTETRSEVWSK